MRDDTYLHAGVFSLQRSPLQYRLYERSRRVRESFSCHQAHPRGVMGSRTIYRRSIPVIQGVVESPSTKRHDRSVYGDFIRNGFYQVLR